MKKTKFISKPSLLIQKQIFTWPLNTEAYKNLKIGKDLDIQHI